MRQHGHVCTFNMHTHKQQVFMCVSMRIVIVSCSTCPATILIYVWMCWKLHLNFHPTRRPGKREWKCSLKLFQDRKFGTVALWQPLGEKWRTFIKIQQMAPPEQTSCWWTSSELIQCKHAEIRSDSGHITEEYEYTFTSLRLFCLYPNYCLLCLLKLCEFIHIRRRFENCTVEYQNYFRTTVSNNFLFNNVLLFYK